MTIQHFRQNARQRGMAIFQGDEPAGGAAGDDGVGVNRLHIVFPISDVDSLLFRYNSVGNLRRILRLRKGIGSTVLNVRGGL